MNPSEPGLRFRRLVLPIILLVNLAYLASKIGQLTQSFSDEQLCHRDFISIYLLAKSVLSGINPYLPLGELAARWPDFAGCNVFAHPSPHPPALAILAAPLGLIGY